MKRAFALLVVLCLLGVSAAFAEDSGTTQTLELENQGIRVMRAKTVGETDTMIFSVQYPVFESDEPSLAQYLAQAVTEPLLALRKTQSISADATVYTAENKDYVRMNFAASLDFPGILSVEASVSNRAADQSINETLFFYRIIDLQNLTELTVYDLFSEPRDAVDVAIRNAVFAKVQEQGVAIVTDASQVPAPNSYYLSSSIFRCLFAAGTVSQKAIAVDVTWQQLGLTQVATLTGTTDATMSDSTADAQMQQQSSDDATPAESVDYATLLTVNDWKVGDQYLRFMADGSVADPMGGDPMFIQYKLEGERLYLDSSERADQAATVNQTAESLVLTFDPEISDYETLTLVAASVPQEADTGTTDAPTESLLSPVPQADVATPTPMPLTGDDADIMTFLTQGLWKSLGTDGNTYYQFTADGKLLTIEVSPYTILEGSVQSDSLSGTVAPGGTAFTITSEDGTQSGYVLNRSATAIPVEQFVTASPTPTPGPTATPSPTPTESPTPSPSPTPAPTLSPYEQAAQSAPLLAPLGDASFAKRQTLKVYSAPQEDSFRDSKAQVTTDESVSIFGTTGDWVLVSYVIGNGSKGRVGYVANTTLADATNVAQLSFADVAITLTKNAKATDDPLNGKSKLFEIKKDTEVKLLAFMGTDWAYIETTYKSKPCRVFIPRASLMAE